MTAAIGHGGDNLQAMIPYTEDRFGDGVVRRRPQAGGCATIRALGQKRRPRAGDKPQ